MGRSYSGDREKEEAEDAAIAKFIEYLHRARRVSYRQTARNVVINAAGTNYDVELTPSDPPWPRLAIDVMQLFDHEGAAEYERRRGYYWAALKTELNAAEVGPYVVSFPYDTAPVRRDVTKLAKEHAQAIKNAVAAAPDEAELAIGAFRATYITGLERPALSTSHAEWVDPYASQPQLVRNLAKKNTQLAVADHERVVVILNRSLLVDLEGVRRVIATMDTSNLTNIDRVFLEIREGFDLVYERGVRDSFGAGGDFPSEPDSVALLDSWLQEKLSKNSREAIQLVRRRTEEAGSMAWLENRETRTAVIRCVCQSVAEGDIELGLWAARVSVEDIDPPLANYPDDPDGKWNCHQRVLRHDDSMGITTVRGNVCCLLEQLVVTCGSSHAEELVAHVERLARDENAYVRLQAVRPLIRLSERRRCVDSDGHQFYSPDVKERIRSLAMEMWRANAGLPRILDQLGWAISELRDLNEAEATEVLDALLSPAGHDGREPAAWLLVYFAEYAETAKGQPALNAMPFKARLVEALRCGPNRLRATIAFQMRQNLENDFEHGRRLLPYLPLFVSDDVDGRVTHHLLEIAELVFGAESNADVERVVLAAVERVVKHSDPKVLVSLYSLLPVLDALAARGRWPVVVAASRLVAEAPVKVFYDNERLLKLLALVPESLVDDAHAVSELLARPAPAVA